jgi:hypothetical protein
MIAEFYGKLSKQERILLLAAAGMIGLVVMDQMVLGPILSRIKVLDAEIGAKTQTIKKSLRILSYRDSILREYGKYNAYFDAGGKTREEIIADLLKKIETLARQKQLTILSVEPGDVKENPVFQEYQTRLNCEGKLGNLLGFMNLLEESDYLFQITEYTLAPKSKGSDILKASMAMSRILMAAEHTGAEPSEPAGARAARAVVKAQKKPRVPQGTGLAGQSKS